LIVERLPLARFQHFLRETFREIFLHRIASVGGSHVSITYSVHFGGNSRAYFFFWVIYQQNRYMSSVRKLLINLALDHFLQWYTVFRSLIHEFHQLALFTLPNRI